MGEHPTLMRPSSRKRLEVSILKYKTFESEEKAENVL
jgi:hypothetical protein